MVYRKITTSRSRKAEVLEMFYEYRSFAFSTFLKDNTSHVEDEKILCIL